jgi:hypothetical protein
MSTTVRRQHDPTWETPEPLSFDCLLEHLKAAVDGLTRFAAEYQQLHDEIEERLSHGSRLTDKQLETIRRIGGWLDADDLKDYNNAPKALAKVAGANDDLYFDALRLSGEILWDDAEKNWVDTGDLAQRDAMSRYQGRRSSEDSK